MHNFVEFLWKVVCVCVMRSKRISLSHSFSSFHISNSFWQEHQQSCTHFNSMKIYFSISFQTMVEIQFRSKIFDISNRSDMSVWVWNKKKKREKKKINKQIQKEMSNLKYLSLPLKFHHANSINDGIKFKSKQKRNRKYLKKILPSYTQYLLSFDLYSKYAFSFCWRKREEE